jgi:hypothetical protein
LGRFFGAIGWYAACFTHLCQELTWIGLTRTHGLLAMFTALTTPGLTLLFLGVVVGLGTAFVWMLWEIEQTSKPHRNSDRFG